jgi:hypothetical protein
VTDAPPPAAGRRALIRAARHASIAAVLAWLFAVVLGLLGLASGVFMLPSHPERWQGAATLLVAAVVMGAVARAQRRAARRCRHAARDAAARRETP